jgi:hypothetical protein
MKSMDSSSVQLAVAVTVSRAKMRMRMSCLIPTVGDELVI